MDYAIDSYPEARLDPPDYGDAFINEMEEQVSDFLDEKANFDSVVECDIDLANGFLRSIYLAVNRPESLAVLAKGWKCHVDEVAENILRGK